MDIGEDLARVAALNEPNRRRVYDELSRSDRPRSRSELAAALAMSENLITFHLDRLAAAHVVRVVPAAAEPGRRGRPARHYELLEPEVSASVPPRRYDVVAEVLALAERERKGKETFRAACVRVAEVYGHDLASTRPPDGKRGTKGALTQFLSCLGYEPHRAGSQVLLDNCPFRRLREINTPLVCNVNHALVEGYLAGLGLSESFEARLAPDERRCCVVVSEQKPA